MEAAGRRRLPCFTRPLHRRETPFIIGGENGRMRRLIAFAAATTTLVALALVQTGAAGPGAGALGNYFFGPKLVRAEVVMSEAGVLHDYRVDRGKIRALAPGSLTLLEKDGTLVTVPVAVGADIRFQGASV